MIRKIINREWKEQTDNASENQNCNWVNCIEKQLLQTKTLIRLTKEKKRHFKNSIERTKLKIKNKKKERNIRARPRKDFVFEKYLKKIGTKGVTHFFNTVKSQQKTVIRRVNKKLPTNILRNDGLLKNIDKRRFLNVLFNYTNANR